MLTLFYRQVQTGFHACTQLTCEISYTKIVLKRTLQRNRIYRISIEGRIAPEIGSCLTLTETSRQLLCLKMIYISPI